MPNKIVVEVELVKNGMNLKFDQTQASRATIEQLSEAIATVLCEVMPSREALLERIGYLEQQLAQATRVH